MSKFPVEVVAVSLCVSIPLGSAVRSRPNYTLASFEPGTTHPPRALDNAAGLSHTSLECQVDQRHASRFCRERLT